MTLKEFLSNTVREFQQKTADSIGHYVNKLTVRQRKVSFILLGLIAGTFFFLLIIGTVGTEESKHALKVDSISVPKDIHRFSLDSLKVVPLKILDSLSSIVRNLKLQ